MSSISLQSDPQHPGIYIAAELEKRGWNQADLAFILGVASSTVSNLVLGKRAIDAALAKALAEAFDADPDHLLNLQKQFDLATAEETPIDMRRRALIQRQYPLREMIKRGWIEGEERGSPPLEERVTRFFGVDSIDAVPHIGHAARKSDYKEEMPATQLAWLFRVRSLAEEMGVPPYSKAKLEEAVAVMRSTLPAPTEIRHVPILLQQAGVRFVVVEGLPGGKIDGVCMWLDNNSPVIGMSLRFDRIDNFWFVLRHEIEHVLNGDGKQAPIVDADMDPSATDIPVEEQRANAAAADFCVPKKKIDSFFRRKYPLFSRSDVLTFSQMHQTHPGLVVGQIQHRADNYALLRETQVKVRSYITDSALTDGWGNVIPVYL